MLAFDKKIIHLGSVGSTNNYAMALIKKGMAQSGNAVSASIQTEGKGRRGKQWSSAPDENILLSTMVEMLWQPVLYQFPLSVAVSLGCIDFLQKYLPTPASVKWPNDIFYNDSKAAGILIENLISGTKWQWAVIGVGLNVNQSKFDDVPQSVTSLRMILQRELNVPNLTAELHNAILNRINRLSDGNEIAFLEEYNRHLYGQNQRAYFKKDQTIFEAVIQKVNAFGQLVLQRENHIETFDFNEISFEGLV